MKRVSTLFEKFFNFFLKSFLKTLPIGIVNFLTNFCGKIVKKLTNEEGELSENSENLKGELSEFSEFSDNLAEKKEAGTANPFSI